MAYAMHVQTPGAVSFDEDEVERIDRAQLALLLHKLPEEIDRMPDEDRYDVLAIAEANQEIINWRVSRRSG